MSAFEDLKDKLREIFQLDRNDLDFGVYRIMNLKSEEVTKFIEEDLLPQVKAGLASYASDDSANLKEELEKTVAQLRGAGLTEELINTTPKVVELNERLKDAFSPEKVENEIYSDLYNFFKRYYSDGDFMSLRRYKDGVYALPYEGEEVKLHWANADQYYIKSSETLSNYTFKIEGKKIRFEVVDATTEQNNNKDDKNRRFRLCKGTEEELKNPVSVKNNEFVVAFTYLATEGNVPTQKNINEEIFDELLANPLLANIAEALKRTTSDASRLPILQKHINNFTAKNTFDYFIHKDLRGFLNRELDFFIKNEIMHLDDIENESVTKVEQYLGKIKILRSVAHKIIDFLASVENFQKKLWLKKKFVLETNYCVTLDRVSEELYPEIIKNKTQHDEWIKLFAIDEIRGEELGSVPYSNPLTVKFLKANPFLVLDTQFFSTEFKYKLLSSIDNLEENTNGLLIHSENFQALNFITNKYEDGIDCVYIDPPYNTNSAPILYKNNYKDSSWNSMYANRLSCVRRLMTETSYIMQAIDDVELRYLVNIADNIFHKDNYIATITTLCNPQGRVADKTNKISEYHLLYAKSISNIDELWMEKRNETRGNTDLVPLKRTGTNSRREVRPLRFYPILEKEGKLFMISDDEYYSIYIKNRSFDEDFIKKLVQKYEKDGYMVIFPLKNDGTKLVWQREFNRVKQEIDSYTYRNGNIYTPAYDIEIPKTMWTSSYYSNPEYGTEYVKEMFGSTVSHNLSLNTIKSFYTVSDLINLKSSNLICDYFAGSGTTGHAVINLNRQDGGDRKYILCEMGKYFDTVTKPRIEKVIYSEEWKDGKPKSRKGSSHMFKYVRLESYEDCLDNLKFDRTKGQDDWLDNNPSAREDYMIKYMMDLETKDSILDIKKFETPFDYQINITRDGEIKQVNVDLVETFNFLIGLNVDHIEMLRNVLVVEGTTRTGEKTLVLWRNVNKIDNDALDAWFKKCKYSTADSEFDVIYVNGDNNLENLRRDDQTWKVRLTEAEFQKRMFDVQDVK